MASVLIASCSIAKADIWRTTRTNLWFLGVLFVVLLFNTYVPDFALLLVNLIYGT